MHQIVGDTAADQLAIEQDVIGRSQHDDIGARVADLGQAVELLQDMLRIAICLQNNELRRGVLGVIRDGRLKPAELDVQVGARQLSVAQTLKQSGLGLFRQQPCIDVDPKNDDTRFFADGSLAYGP